jgi:hypothetical protein
MPHRGPNESDQSPQDRQDDDITEPGVELAEYDDDDAATLPWLPRGDRRTLN